MNKINYTTHYARSKKNIILIFSNLDNLTLSGIYTSDLFEYIKGTFNYEKLYDVAYIATKNLNKSLIYI